MSPLRRHNKCGKTAATILLLYNPLCFMLRRIGKAVVNPLKRDVLDFHSVELDDAKSQLLDVTKSRILLA